MLHSGRACARDEETSLLTWQHNLAKLYAIRMLFWMHFFSAVLVPFYTQWGGLKLSEVLFLNAWFMFWNFALEVPTGTVADFLGRKVSLAMGSVIGIVAALVYVSRPGLPTFLLAEILFAVAYTLHSGADEALAYDSLKAMDQTGRAKRVIARMESCKLGGIIFGALVGSFLAARFDLTTPMRSYMVPGGLAFLVALTLREPPILEPGAPRRAYGTILREGMRFLLGHKVLLLMTTELALTNALAWGIIWLYQALLIRAGMPLAYFGAVHAACCAGQILLLSNVERLESFLGSKRRLLVLSCLAAGAAFMALGLTTQLALVVAAIVAAFSFSLPRIAVFSAYMNQHIPSDKRATVLSVSSMFRTLAIVVVNPVTGLLADWSLDTTMLALGSALILLAAVSRIEERHLIG